jgi:hypothetical protein
MSPARPSDGPARWWSEGAGGHINAVFRLIEPMLREPVGVMIVF